MPDLARISPLVGAASPSQQLADLEDCYTLSSAGDSIQNLLVELPTLYTLLMEAVKPLQVVFGGNKLLRIEALESDEDTVLRVMVKLPADTPQPAELMRKFKRDWWFKNSRGSQAFLVFDYEIGNGF
jgi:hypothetical protein